MWSSLWAVGKWLVATFVKVLAWTAAHPVAAVLVGATAAIGGAWLKAQPWAGADIVGRVVGSFGLSLLLGGMGAWLGGKVLGAVGRAVGAATPFWYKYIFQQRFDRPWLP